MKKKYTLLVFLFVLQSSFGQIGFEENFVNDGNNYIIQPKYVSAADLDGDGDNDLITYGASEIAWNENIDGFGTFVSKQTIRLNTGSTAVSSLVVADLDGDGDNDVIASLPSQNKVVWYENIDGLGDFTEEQVIITSAIYPETVFVSDIDGDGDMDVLVASSNDSQVAWYENTDGLGTFGPQNIIASNDTFKLYASDVDGDGDLDVITTSTDNKIAWYENMDGFGTFGTEQIITTSVSEPYQIYLSDLDGDGDNDLLSSSFSTTNIVWQENLDGLGNFGTPQNISTNSNFTTSIFVQDIDADGDLDVMSSSGLDDKIAWYKNIDGLGTFTEDIISIDTDSAQSVYAADIDNDGDLDVLSASSTDHKIAWYKNTNGIGDFGTEIIITQQRARDIETVFSEDIDGDGDMDVVSASANVDGVFWHKNVDDQGQFSVPILISSEITNVRSLVVFDIDYDGDMDILVSSQGNDNVVWLENLDGEGTFGAQNDIVGFSYATSLFVADMDGDGYKDVVTNAGNLRWMKNVNGEGVFVTGNTVFGINGLTSIFVADLDNDNDMDVLVNSFQDNYIAWYENLDGAGNLGNLQIISDLIDYPLSVYASDINQDGYMDVLSASKDDDKIAWYENDGLGGFGVQQVISTSANGANTVMTSDIDGDGDLDVFATSEFDNKIAWYENIDGLGAFGSEQIVTLEANSVKTVCVADIDTDGDIDFISAFPTGTSGSNLPESVKWYENTGVLTNEILGVIRYDVNDNGCDTSDFLASGVLVTTENGTSSFSTFTTEDGIFQFFPNEGSFTTTIQSSLPAYYDVSPISNTSNFSGIGNTELANFCFNANTNINDINISIYPSINDPRPGFDTTYQIVYSNVGTTQLSGNVSFEYDETKLNLLNASETVTSQTANTVTFNFTDLNPFETRIIDLEFNVFAPPITNIDDELLATATVNPVSGDETEENNVFTLEQTVIGSYDPNDIRVLEGEEILLEDADKYLHYIIRFQNTGTASAININVENVLDTKLDWTTMQLESLSHTGRVEITNGNMAKFIFNNINLPDSTSDEPNSHGFIAYKIKPKDNVVIGDTFNNTADIFFDFNLAIVTNTVATTIVNALSVDEFEAKVFTIHPNPTNSILNIESKTNIDSIIVYDLNGRILRTKEAKSKIDTIDVSSLPQGMYFIEIKSLKNKVTQKFIKK